MYLPQQFRTLPSVALPLLYQGVLFDPESNARENYGHVRRAIVAVAAS